MNQAFLVQLARELTALHLKIDAMRGLFIRLGIPLDDIDQHTDFVTNHPAAHDTFHRILQRVRDAQAPEASRCQHRASDGSSTCDNRHCPLQSLSAHPAEPRPGADGLQPPLRPGVRLSLKEQNP